MKCTPLKDADGKTIGIVCGTRRRAPRCVTCKSPSTQLCDFELPATRPKAPARTCDRALCKRCSRRDEANDKDYCAEHAHALAHRKPVAGVCRGCGCTEADCRQCIAKDGHPCSWIDATRTLCTSCNTADLAP